MAFKHRLLLFTLVWFLASAALLTLLSVSVWQENALRSRQELHKELAIHMRDDNPLMVGDDYSPKALSSIFHTLMLLGPDFEIYFLDPDGNLTTSGPPKEEVVRQQIDVTPIQQFLAGEPFPILGPDPLSASGSSVFSAAAIEMDGALAGYLYVVIGNHSETAFDDQASLTQYLPVVGAALIAILLFALVVYRMVKRQIIQPGRLMVRQISESAKSQFRVSPPLSVRAPELQELASQFQRMMAVIQQQFVQLRVQEAQRREYLMQLNHDLKTPLANVLGYLETWRIQHHEGRNMIDTAYQNAQRLQAQLKTQLEVARSPGAELVLSSTDIEVTRFLEEVRQRFELSSKGKQIDIDVNAPDSLRMIADELLINRVFDNLMENAIRHSPQGGTITLSAEKSGTEKVRFCVENPIDDESHHGSLGMGNKIVDAILSLHHSKLNVTKLNATKLNASSETQETPSEAEETPRYRVCFALPLADEKARVPVSTPAVNQDFEDEVPRLESDYPDIAADPVVEGEAERLEEVHFSAKEETPDTLDVPSFNAFGGDVEPDREETGEASEENTKKDTGTDDNKAV